MMGSPELKDELYINIGTVKCCLFAPMSLCLLREMKRYPLLYFAVEESLECARIGYYGIGIIAFAQLLNLLNEKTPDDRNRVAHEFLKSQPSKTAFDEVVEKFKSAAAKESDKELAKAADVSEYKSKLSQEWQDLMKQLHNLA